jgi:hypothetical protein
VIPLATPRISYEVVIMFSHAITQGPITLTYGLDKITGYFLNVSDARLRYENNTEGENLRVIEVFDASQSGLYFQIHTASIGFGQKVSEETFAHFLKLYGGKEEHIEAVKAGKGYYLARESVKKV